ncbi:family 43 glycosylhydrolase [Candidatus Bathyarchaeota archaeon]|nr:family 43 glycosylhydrolase [Candidatus Bathyarchaeota archaeon]
MHLLRSLSALTGIFALCSAYTNPLREEWGADPTVAHSDDGYYYLLSTNDVDVQITRATTIEGLKTGEKKVVYVSEDPDRCCNNWAPEMHLLGERWYIYFTSGRSADLDGQRSHVLAGRP